MDEALAFADAAEGEERGEERRKGWLWRKPRKPPCSHSFEHTQNTSIFGLWLGMEVLQSSKPKH